MPRAALQYRPVIELHATVFIRVDPHKQNAEELCAVEPFRLLHTGAVNEHKHSRYELHVAWVVAGKLKVRYVPDAAELVEKEHPKG